MKLVEKLNNKLGKLSCLREKYTKEIYKNMSTQLQKRLGDYLSQKKSISVNDSNFADAIESVGNRDKRLKNPDYLKMMYFGNGKWLIWDDGVKTALEDAWLPSERDYKPASKFSMKRLLSMAKSVWILDYSKFSDNSSKKDSRTKAKMGSTALKRARVTWYRDKSGYEVDRYKYVNLLDRIKKDKIIKDLEKNKELLAGAKTSDILADYTDLYAEAISEMGNVMKTVEPSKFKDAMYMFKSAIEDIASVITSFDDKDENSYNALITARALLDAAAKSGRNVDELKMQYTSALADTIKNATDSWGRIYRDFTDAVMKYKK